MELSGKLTQAKIIIIKLSIVVWIISSMTGCETKTYLTDSEKEWNPYTNGQKLIFQGADRRIDTLQITGVADHLFADGLGAPQNERLKVDALYLSEKGVPERRFLYITAKDKKTAYIDFRFSLEGNDFWGRGYLIESLTTCKKITIRTPYKTFDDVLEIHDNSQRRLKDHEIATIFWSVSFGYIKYIRQDGNTGELIGVIDP